MATISVPKLFTTVVASILTPPDRIHSPNYNTTEGIVFSLFPSGPLPLMNADERGSETSNQQAVVSIQPFDIIAKA
ncbi:MAG: hypothetical protein ACM3SW_09285 [Actinomycetota bacterium]